ncbi:MAG: type II toxin-antitoxin system VapC family toxin [Chloroflexi bacterium]|nr:type II toxin-antitoxin system VapC family toxin [Chloroflexota bacterium]
MKNSRVCVDASLIVPVLLPHSLSEKAEALLARFRDEDVVLYAPALLAFEVVSTIRGFVHLNMISPARGEQAVTQFLRMPIRLSSRSSIFPLALRLAEEFNRPRAYDTAYLALARILDCEFWTADERLYNAVLPNLPWVKWIGGFVP